MRYFPPICRYAVPSLQLVALALILIGSFNPPSARAQGSIPSLHSRSGAPHKLYLDFNGHEHPGITVLCSNGTSNWTAGLPAGYSVAQAITRWDTPANQQFVRDVWARVAEDFAPFNVDVTTVEPATLVNPDVRASVFDAVRIAVGRVTVRDGNKTFILIPGGEGRAAKPCDDRGSAYLELDIPRLGIVAMDDISQPGLTARSISHEAGHVYGLDHHDGTLAERDEWNSAFTVPIMGGGRQLTYTWYAGTADNQFQDDAVILSGLLGSAPEEDWDFVWSARMLLPIGSTASPLQQLKASGTIGRPSDLDWYTFRVTGSGSVTINLRRGGVDLIGATEGEGPEPNLRARVTLFDGTGTRVIAEANTPSVLPLTLPALAPQVLPPIGGGSYVQTGIFYRILVSNEPQLGGLQAGNLGQYALEVGGPVADLSGPRVIDAHKETCFPAPSQERIRVKFSQPIHYLPFSVFTPLRTFELTAPDGRRVPILKVRYVTPATGLPVEFDLYFASLSMLGKYTLRVGPDIAAYGSDPSGAPYAMDQNGDGFNGRAADVYQGVFNLDGLGKTQPIPGCSWRELKP